jgi:glyceraldehyde 3-phosphate dehydrogenase
MLKIAINGLGRIGRAALKQVIDNSELELVAVNDLVPADNLEYLLKYDTVYGRYEKSVESKKDSLTIDGKDYKLLQEKDPANLPWKDLAVDVVLECTGVFTRKEDLEKHIRAGAKYVILSAPAKGEEVETIVHGVNKPDGSSQIISCASCTTNCITPVVEVLGRRIGVKKAIMTTVHAYTSSQGIVDSPNKKMRRGRAAAANFVPTSTGAAKATTKALPEYEGKFDGIAIRGPVPCGSIADLVFVMKKDTTKEEVNKIFKEESEGDQYKGILSVTEDELVSSDILKSDCASIVDLSMTQVVDGDLVKVLAWYDNEWGYVSQMMREVLNIAKA